MKHILAYLCFAFLPLTLLAQEEDLLKELPADTPRVEYVAAAFKSTRVIMSHSIEMLPAGVLDFRILHRFGKINGGISEFFGLDGPANVRLGLDYGLTDNFTAGIGRSGFNKEVDGFLKYRLARQSTGSRNMPFSLVVAGGALVRTAPWPDLRIHPFSDRMSYYLQAIAGRKFSDGFSLQLSPVYLHRNYVEPQTGPNGVFAMGTGARLRLSRRVSLTADYFYVFNLENAPELKNPLSIGFDIETGGHVFQLHFTNAHGMNEKAFLTQTVSTWGSGEVEFGFNISRVFQLKKRRP